jgi:hypothetical protein
MTQSVRGLEAGGLAGLTIRICVDLQVSYKFGTFTYRLGFQRSLPRSTTLDLHAPSISRNDHRASGASTN